jgi:hypothetical protein
MLLQFVLLLPLAAWACGDAGTDGPPQSEPAADVRSAGADAAAVGRPAADALLITSSGIAHATRGLSLGELRRALPATQRIGALDPAFMVDVSAAAVIAGNDTLYHALFWSTDVLQDSIRIQMVATQNRRARTADGLGPGVTLADAASTCGPLTLSYNVHDESREYVTCAEHPPAISFRTSPVSDERMFAGEYATDAEYNTTMNYDPAARIRMVIVDLFAALD